MNKPQKPRWQAGQPQPAARKTTAIGNRSVGACFLVRDDGGPAAAARFARLGQAMAAQGFAAPAEFAAAGWRAAVYPKQCGVPVSAYSRDRDNFAFAAGTLLYRERHGAAAVREFFDRYDGLTIDWDGLRGAFCLAVCRNGRLVVATDRMGVYKLYRDRDSSLFSSSFLAALADVERPTLDRQGIYEYVFNGATFGERTVAAEVRQFDWRHSVALGRTVERHPVADRHARAFADLPFADHVQQATATLRAWFADIVKAFGGNIDTALSGGYDSRLILALLRDRGVKPRVHVYGRSDDADVVIARAMAAGEGIGLDQVDKSRWPTPSPDEFAEVLRGNFSAFDGYPADGLFDGGADEATRRDRGKGGAVMLNGGGGEIFRNFFYLRDGRFGVRDVLRTFFSQFDPACATAAFSAARYYDLLGAAMKQTLGTDSDMLSRWEVEYLYPYFRCSYWMGRNNSVNNRFGFALTPFIEPIVVGAALRVPLGYKDLGRFQGALIAAIDPKLAGYPSAYGYALDAPPSWQRRLKYRLDLGRPALLRSLSFRAKARWRRFQSWRQAQRPPLLCAHYLERVIDPEFPLMRHFFHPERVHDNEQFARLCTLEYLCQRHGLTVAAGAAGRPAPDRVLQPLPAP